MKSLNRTLSLVLVLVMVLGMFGIAGATFKDQDKIENTEAVDTMVALNIINGKGDNTFDPAAGVTRAEMAKMISVALNGGKEPVLSTSATPLFTDIGGHWGQKYIEYCANIGIVAGMGDGTFSPDTGVTGSQAAKMMLVAMGYNAKVFGFEGANWEVNVNVSANKAGLYADLSIDASAAISRDNAAQLIYNGINAANMVRGWTQNPTTGEITETYQLGKADETSIAVTKFDLKTTYVTLGAVKYDAVDKEYDVLYTNDSGDTMPNATTFSCATDYSSFYGMNVKVLWTTDKANNEVVYGVYAHKSSVVLAGVVGQLSDAIFNASDIKLNGTTYKFDGDSSLVGNAVTTLGGTYNAVTSTPVDRFNEGVPVETSGGTLAWYYAKATTSALGAAYNPALASYAFKALDTDGNGKIDKVIVYPFTVHKVTYVGTTAATITAAATFGSGSGTITFADDVVYDGIAKGDFVKKTAGVNTVSGDDTYEKITTMSGKVEKTTTTNGVPKAQINGIYFVDMGVSLTLGNTYENIAQVNTFAFFADLAATSASGEDYAVMIAGRTDSAYGGHYAKLLFADGTVKEVETAKDYKATGSAVGDVGGAGVDVLVEFTKSSTNIYTLKTATATPGGYDGLLTSPAFNASSSGATIGTAKNAIDDNAVILVKETSTPAGYKVMTGAQAKTLSAAKVTTAFYRTNSSTGFNTIALAFISVAPTASSYATNYGYMTANVATSKDENNDTIYDVTFWNGTEVVTKTASFVPADFFNKGTIFQYTLDTKGRMRVAPVTSLTKAEVGAFDGTNISFTGYTSNTSSKINDKTVVFYVDTKENTGIAGGAIQIAQPGTANAYFVDGTNANDPYKFIVFDVNNEVQALSTVTLTAPTADEVTAAFTSYATVKISGDLDLDDDIEIPAGKTLAITGDLDVDDNTLTVTGTLTVGGTIAIGGTSGTIDFAAAPSAAIMGKLETSPTVGSTVIFGEDVPDAAASDTAWYDSTNTVIATADVSAGIYVYDAAADGSSTAGWLEQ